MICFLGVLSEHVDFGFFTLKQVSLFPINHMRSFFTLVLVVVFCCVAGVSKANDIIFLGDDARLAVIKQCGGECNRSNFKIGAPDQGASASEVANAARTARHAIIVVDAATGPLPITREHILIARQAGVPSLSVMFVNMLKLEGMKDAAELVELEEHEVRELMNKYEMGGDTTKVFHDASIRSISKLNTNGIGIKAALNNVQTLSPRKITALQKYSGRTFSAYLYLLSKLESKNVIGLSKGTVVSIWINGQSVKAIVKSEQPLSPGGNAELLFEAQTPINAPIGSRLILESDGKIIAAGVLSRGG